MVQYSCSPATQKVSKTKAITPFVTEWEKIASSKNFVPSTMTDQYYPDAEKNALVWYFSPGIWHHILTGLRMLCFLKK